MLNIIYKFISFFLAFFFVILFLFLSVYLIKRIIDKDQPTTVWGIAFFEVSTGSMEPEIMIGDLIITKKIKDDQYQVGMIVTYLPPNAKTPVTHQIVKRDGNIITTRGINEETNNIDDEPFDVSCIIGKKIGIWHQYNRFANFIKSPFGIIVFVLGGFLIIEGYVYIDKKIKKVIK